MISLANWKYFATFALAKVCPRTCGCHILPHYDHVRGDGVSGRHIVKKRLLTLCFGSLELRTLLLPTEHSNDRRHIVCIVHTFLLFCSRSVIIYIRRGVFVARSSVRASSKASVMELATMKVPRFLY